MESYDNENYMCGLVVTNSYIVNSISSGVPISRHVAE